ncbi:MAG: peptidoglycan -binding protein [Pseudomonadota bacterium]
MALSRRSGQRFQGSIWPGFVDAMTALLLVLIFVLTIFMVVQSIQSEEILGQETELDRLTARVSELGQALGLAQQRNAGLEDEIAGLNDDITQAQSEAALQDALISSFAARAAEQSDTLLDLETQVASLVADRDAALEIVTALEGDLQASEADRVAAQDRVTALDIALAQARDEIDAEAEAARLAAARREALEAMVADLEAREAALTAETETLNQQSAEQAEALSETEAARLAEAAAAEALRERLSNADAELTSLSLSLEAERKEAEDTLTLLAAAELARDAALEAQAEAEVAREAALNALTEAEAAQLASGNDAATAVAARAAAEAALAEAEARKAEADARAAEAAADAADALTEAERQRALLVLANETIARAGETQADTARDMALLNQQVADLRAQLGDLQALLDASEAKDADSQIQIEALGARLNAALAQAASEQRRRADLEEAERIRLEEEAKRLEEEARRLAEEAKSLENYRSDFFGRMREALGGLDGVEVVGDRFAFSSEVLFDSGSADLSFQGASEIAKLAAVLKEVSQEIPNELNWVIRVDGHTDNVPLSGGGFYRDNWELSQARALSVVRFLTDAYGFPANRLAATGFGEYQPVDPADSDEARARNRRIEIKLTER